MFKTRPNAPGAAFRAPLPLPGGGVRFHPLGLTRPRFLASRLTLPTRVSFGGILGHILDAEHDQLPSP